MNDENENAVLNTQPDPKESDLVSFDSSDDDSSKPTKSPNSPSSIRGLFGFRGCLIGVIAILVLGSATVYAYQQWFGPKVDPDLTEPEILATEGGPSDPAQLTGITAGLSDEAIENADHPLEPALKIAKRGLENIENNVADYQTVMVKQARIGKKLSEVEHLQLKIRHAGKAENGDEIPLSIYMKFLAPQSALGQEVIYVDGWNDGKLVAHLPGMMNFKRIYLKPESPLAMRGNIYPITMIGMKKLIQMMIEKGENDLEYDECKVTFNPSIEIDGRKCLLLRIEHPIKRDHFEFHIAKVYIDLEYELPVAYEGYLWPEKEGDEPPLYERYIYTELKLNTGLSDADFDPANEAYNYPAR